MGVALETTIKRYVGLSTDTKPYPSLAETLPAGSSFLESDTGKIYRWDGSWKFGAVADESAYTLALILTELSTIRMLVELATSSK